MNKFFPINNLSFKQRKELLTIAKEKSYNWWVDILEDSCVYRKRIDMSFEEIIEKFDNTCHFHIVHRNNNLENYLEIGFSTLKSPDYFLWILLDVELIPFIESKLC